MSRAGRSGRGSGDPTVADPDLLAGRLFFGVPIPGPARAPLEAALPRLEPRRLLLLVLDGRADRRAYSLRNLLSG